MDAPVESSQGDSRFLLLFSSSLVRVCLFLLFFFFLRCPAALAELVPISKSHTVYSTLNRLDTFTVIVCFRPKLAEAAGMVLCPPRGCTAAFGVDKSKELLIVVW